MEKSVLGQNTCAVPLSTQVYEWVLVCDGLACYLGGTEAPLVVSCYGIRHYIGAGLIGSWDCIQTLFSPT